MFISLKDKSKFNAFYLQIKIIYLNIFLIILIKPKGPFILIGLYKAEASKQFPFHYSGLSYLMVVYWFNVRLNIFIKKRLVRRSFLIIFLFFFF